jgi:hypothetical protein
MVTCAPPSFGRFALLTSVMIGASYVNEDGRVVVATTFPCAVSDVTAMPICRATSNLK